MAVAIGVGNCIYNGKEYSDKAFLCHNHGVSINCNACDGRSWVPVSMARCDTSQHVDRAFRNISCKYILLYKIVD